MVDEDLVSGQAAGAMKASGGVSALSIYLDR